MNETSIFPDKLSMKDTISMYPDGIFIYASAPYTDRKAIQQKLQAALPTRLVIATEPVSIFPTDTGSQIGDTIYGYSIHASYLEQAISERVSLNPQNEDELTNSLPPMVRGGGLNPEGGAVVPLYNTDIVIGRSMSDKIVHIFANANLRLIQPAVLVRYAEVMNSLEVQQGIPTNEQFHFGHIDFYLTGGLDKRTGRITLFIDELLMDLFREESAKYPELENIDLVPVSHERVIRGVLNIEYVDDVALIMSKDAVGEDVYDYLHANCREIVELGDDQYIQRGSVKCRSYKGSWRKNTQAPH